jgi:hypothetical protein
MGKGDEGVCYRLSLPHSMITRRAAEGPCSSSIFFRLSYYRWVAWKPELLNVQALYTIV